MNAPAFPIPAVLVLVDGDVSRRAAISHNLSDSGIHVEPFEDPLEVFARWQRPGLLLVHDDGEAVAAILSHMGRTGNWLPVVGFSENPAPRRIVEVILEGAIDYLAWPFGRDEIAAMMRNAAQKTKALGSAKLREAMARSRLERLTRREREVLTGVADGLSNRLIGERLAISPRTVEIHRANMLTKMGANHTSEAIRIAIEAALVS